MASVVDHLSDAFPRSYIVDGNYFSFPKHARALISGLEGHGVSVTSSLYPDKPELPHEFQFDFSHPESYEVWKQTLAFLRQ
jgi:acetyl esterase/lipase